MESEKDSGSVTSPGSVNVGSAVLPAVLSSEAVDRVGFVFAACETDEKLEQAVRKFLVPLVRSVTLPDVQTRNKVMEVLVHVNKRLKSRPALPIPVHELLLAVTANFKDTFFINFAIVYVKMGFSRLDYEAKVKLMPLILSCAETCPSNHQLTLLAMFVSVFADRVPSASKPGSSTGVSKEPTFPGSNASLDPCTLIKDDLTKSHPKCINSLLQFLMEIVLLPYSRSAESKAPVTEAQGETKPAFEVPGGFSEASYKKLEPLLDDTFIGLRLEKVKLGIVTFVLNLELSADLKVPVLAVACSDSHSVVAEAADEAIKHINEKVDFNNIKMVQKLCLLFCGDKKPKVPLEERVSGVPTKTKLKILPILCKSKTAANQPLDVISVTFESCFGPGTTNKLRHHALLFVHEVAIMASDATLKTVGPLLKNACVKLLGDGIEPALDGKGTNYAVMAIAKLSLRKPELMKDDFNLLTAFFQRLKSADRDQRMALQESLAALAPVYRNLSPEKFETMQSILEIVLELGDNTSVQQILIKFIQNVFPFDHIPSRYLILAITEAQEDIKEILTSPGKPCPSFDDMSNHIKGNQKIPLRVLSTPHVERVCLYLRHCMIAQNDVNCDFKTSDLKKQTKKLQLSADSNSESAKLYLKFVLTSIKENQTPTMFFLLTEILHTSSNVGKEVLEKETIWARNATICYSDSLRLASCEFYGTLKSVLGEAFLDKELDVLNDVNDKNQERFAAVSLSLAFYVAQEQRMSHETSTSLCQRLVKGLKSDSKHVFDITVETLTVVGSHVDVRVFLEEEAQKELFDKIEKSLNYTDACHFKRKEILCNFMSASCLGLENSTSDWATKCIDLLLASSNVKQHDLQSIVGASLLKCSLGPKYPHWASWLEEPDWRKPIDDEDDDILGNLLDRVISDYSGSSIPHLPQTCAHWLSEILGNCPPHVAIKKRATKLQDCLMRLLSSKSETVQDLASGALASLFHMCDEQQRKQLIDHMMNMFTEGTAGKGTKSKLQSGDEQLFAEGEIGKTPSGGSISTYKDLCSLATDMNQPDLVYKFISLANHNLMWNSRKGAAFGFSQIAEQASEELEPHLPKLLPKLYRYKFDPNQQVRESMNRIWSSLASNTQETIEKYAPEICGELLSSLQNSEWRCREAASLAVADFASQIYSEQCCEHLEEIWGLVFRICDDIKDSVRSAGEKALSSLSRAAIKNCGSESTLGSKQKSVVVSKLIPVLVEKGLTSKIKFISETSLNTILDLSTEDRASVLKPHLGQMVQSLLDSLSDCEPSQLNYLSVRAGENSQVQNTFDSARASSAKSSRPMDCLMRLTRQIDESNIEDVIASVCSTVQSAVGFSTKSGVAHVITLITLHCSRDLLQPHAGESSEIFITRLCKMLCRSHDDQRAGSFLKQRISMALQIGNAACVLGTVSDRGKLVKKMTTKLNDKNSIVRRSFSSAIPAVLKIAKSSVVNKYFLKLKEWFFEHHDTSHQETIGRALSDVCRVAPDTVMEHTDVLAPLSFVGKHFSSSESEADQVCRAKVEEINELYDSVWSTVATGNLSGLKLHLKEVISTCSDLAETQSWDRKAQAASTIAQVAKILTGDNGDGGDIASSPAKSPRNESSSVLTAERVDSLVCLLVKMVSGPRYWKGKEVAMAALASVCETQHNLMIASSEQMTNKADQLWDLAHYQWNRPNDAIYDTECAKCCARIALFLTKQLSHYQQILELVKTKLEKSFAKRKSKSDTDETVVGLSPVQHQCELIKCLSFAYPNYEADKSAIISKINSISVEHIKKCGDKSAIRIGLESLKAIVEREIKTGQREEEKLIIVPHEAEEWTMLFNNLLSVYSDFITTDSLRVLYFGVLSAMIPLLDGGDSSQQLERDTLEELCSRSLKAHAQHGHTVAIIKKIQTQLNLGDGVANV